MSKKLSSLFLSFLISVILVVPVSAQSVTPTQDQSSSVENSIQAQPLSVEPSSSQLAPDSSNSNESIQSIIAPVWVTKSFNVTKNGRTVTVEWGIATDSIIREVNASFKTGAGWTEATSFKGPNTGGVTLSQTWEYSQPGTYTVGGVAQLYTDKGPASCFSPPRVVVIN
ncbi:MULTISPECIES: hypothetical protein [Paenibacillus]|uniref:Uncharacterized protein n=1 Tax=Paenibacillus polymyxa TaxID=1406 RepID=A0A378Y184_PAEPO|nr:MULTISPECIES: hypothetical protein [Paenibacillus]MCC3261597.1 hypothetical protein [Paenibacillus polymyxa]SUA70047.1 Uncharacterised protein [Paenibacillus polymyxa]